MTKLVLATLLMVAGFGAAPVYADTNGGGGTIGRGCTLDPFNHTMRCIDFDHCTINSKGEKVCPVVVTPQRISLQSAKTFSIMH